MRQLPHKKSFDQLHDGRPVSLLHLYNSKGWVAAVTNYGARLVSLFVPDNNGEFINVVAGFDSLEGYLNSTEHYYGATVGRYANRIANAKFSIGEEEFQLATDCPAFCLHGGPEGFHAKVWNVESVTTDKVVFSYFSPTGEMGFPGNLTVKVFYTMTDNGLRIQYEATTDEPTICNLTHHSFFNLNGHGTIDEHELSINADSYLPLNEQFLPTGEIASVLDTPFDFNKSTAVGKRLSADHPQLLRAGGYDHNYILRNESGEPAAIVKGDCSGITMKLYTDKPGLQLYTTNGLAGKNLLSNGQYDIARSSLCLEPQFFPDSPNQPSFPSALLLPGQYYQYFTELQFSSGLL
jgi:aldose 1-epimerase